MKTSTMHFLLFSLHIGLLGAMPLVAQHAMGQDRRREPREQLFHKRLPDPSGFPDRLVQSPAQLDESSRRPMSYDGKRESLPAEGTQAGDVLHRLPERVRERLARHWDLREIAGLAPTDSKQRRDNDKLAPVVDCSALQMVSFDSVAVDWIATYTSGVAVANAATALAVDGSGNVYVTGGSPGSGTSYDYATVKYNASGFQQWIARYNGPANLGDYATALALDGSGNVYVTGVSIGSGTNYDYATVKYNASGVEQWVARYNGPVSADDRAYALAVDGSSNVYVTGVSIGSGTNYDYATMKYNASGIEQWIARYNGPVNSYDEAFAIVVDGSGNVYVTGLSLGSGTNYDYATVKYNASGIEQWVAQYNGPVNSWDLARAIAVDASGNVFVTGESYGSGTDYDYATVKYNASGVQQWVARYNGPGNADDYATALAVDGSGNVYVTGYSLGSGTYYDYATVKYNASGVEQWVARYSGWLNSSDVAIALALDGSGNVYVTGWSWGTYYDYATVKYNASGVQQWVARYNGPVNADDYATALALDGSGNVYVTGRARFADGQRYTTIKYRQITTGIAEEPELPREFVLYQNYPNPFNPSTTIKFTLPKSGHVTLKVYDVLGREVATLLEQEQSAGEHRVEWKPEGISSGIYTYRLTTPYTTIAKKMLFLR